jgi:hypothetical protein
MYNLSHNYDFALSADETWFECDAVGISAYVISVFAFSAGTYRPRYQHCNELRE